MCTKSFSGTLKVLVLFLIISFRVISASSFGYISYSTLNIGDEIQSLAAKQFLPDGAVGIEREFISEFSCRGKLPTIINGWFMHTKQCGWCRIKVPPPAISWPPSPSLEPLLISIHLSPGFIKEAFTPEGIEYFKTHGPVGARDYFTLRELQKRDIPSYFSGCLTLTLQKQRPAEDRSGIIYAVDLDKQCIDYIKSKTKRRVESIGHINLLHAKPTEKKEEYARQLLLKYEEAHCVITTRLHAALPCLALETPVLLLGYDESRFEGLAELVRHCSKEQLLNGQSQFDFDLPAPNSNKYKSLRENLINTVQEWIKTGQHKVFQKK